MNIINNLKVGKVTHYYDKIKVAVVELSGDLMVGDIIKFSKEGDDLFEQVVESIQVEHKKVVNAKSGDVVGLQVNDEAKEGTEIYKIS